MAKKPVLTAKEAAAMIPDGATIMCGGFLACGQARAIVKELVARGTKDLTLIANDMGRATGPMGEEFFGIAELIHNHQVKRVIATHVGMTPEVGQQNTEGTLEVNLLPQGTLAECIRAGGAGLGLSIVHETVYENRFGFTKPLVQMGATIQLYRECLGSLPCRFQQRNYKHSAVIFGPTPLTGRDIDVPDLRGGFSHLIAALAASGPSNVHGISLIDRGYADFRGKLAALGADFE